MIAFVTLNVFQILNEQCFGRALALTLAGFAESPGEIRIGLSAVFELFYDQITLHHVETGDADARRVVAVQQVIDDLANLLGFREILPLVVGTVGAMQRDGRITIGLFG